MIENGYVKFPREIVGRSWFEDSATVAVYVHLLLSAAFRDIEREGYMIYKGQYVTSVKKLADACRLTIRQTRTALAHLQTTKDITIRTTSKFSIITVNSMVNVSDPDTLADKLVDTLANKQSDNRRSSKEKVKEENKEEKGVGAASPRPALPSDEDNSFCSQEANGREALIKRYGNDTVTSYEQKFREWAAKKKAVNVPMYPTVAKWLSQDIDANAQCSPKPAAANGFENSSIDVDDFERAVMERYKKREFG